MAIGVFPLVDDVDILLSGRVTYLNKNCQNVIVPSAVRLYRVDVSR